MSDAFSFRMLHEWAEAQQPVFVVGPERSGTSMMFRAVVSHPSFCGFDSATVETFCFIRPYLLLEAAAPSNYEMRVYLGKQFAAFSKAVEPIRQINAICDQTNLPQNYLVERRQVVWNKRNYRELLRAFFYFSWCNLGRKRLAEKTPAHVRCIGEIVDCFPKAKILVCLRDPLEIIASHRKRLAKEIELGKRPDDPSLEWLSKSPAHYVEYFRHVSLLVGNAQRHFPKSVKLIPYNRVTQDEAFRRSVFAFIGEDHAALADGKNISAGKSLDWDPLLASMPKENLIEWQSWLSAGEADMVRAACKGTALEGWGR